VSKTGNREQGLKTRDGGTEGQRDGGTEGQRDRGPEGQWDKGPEGQRDRGTEGQKDSGTEDRRDRGTEGQKDSGTEDRGDGGQLSVFSNPGSSLDLGMARSVSSLRLQRGCNLFGIGDSMEWRRG
jgi:hypothetical protein